MKGIVLEPVDPSSAVEGGFASRRFDFVPRDGEYILAKNPRVAGRVRITLEACDQTTAGSCNGVYRIEAYSKSSRSSFIVSFEKFSFRDNFKGLSIYQKDSNFFQGRYLYRLIIWAMSVNTRVLSLSQTHNGSGCKNGACSFLVVAINWN